MTQPLPSAVSQPLKAPEGLFPTSQPVSRIESAKKSVQTLAKLISNKASEIFNSIKEFFSPATKLANENLNKFSTFTKDKSGAFQKWIESLFFIPVTFSF
jgi:hypothetical protein